MTATEPPVTFDGDRMAVRFDRFDVPSYRRFLQVKKLPESSVEFDPEAEAYTVTAPARYAALLGVDRPAFRPAVPILKALYPDQRELVANALDAKRYALWCKCGYGKTLCGLEFARQAWKRTGGRVLVVTLNELVREWQAEADRFYAGRNKLPVVRLGDRAEMREWCESGEPGIGVTNYEKFNPEKGAKESEVVNECRHLAGVVLDEAGRLRNSGGKQKWSLVKSCRGVEYKLLLTATPAPNDVMEFASQAAFLEKMRAENEILWTFFTRDPRTQKWTVKPHARAAFFEWMSTWSVYVNDPKRYGWRLDRPDVPEPDYRTVEIAPTPEQLELARRLAADRSSGQMSLFGPDGSDAVQRVRLSEAAKGFLYDGHGKPQPVPSNKPAKVAEIVRAEHAAGAATLVWTTFDAETEILFALLKDLPGVETLTGATKTKDRPAVIDRFRSGRTRVLLARASMLGYGMNLQTTRAMVFSGWTDSFEQFYQAVRRAYRDGQTERLRVYLPVVRELEGDTLDNIDRKGREHERSIADMEDSYIRARARLRGAA